MVPDWSISARLYPHAGPRASVTSDSSTFAPKKGSSADTSDMVTFASASISWKAQATPRGHRSANVAYTLVVFKFSWALCTLSSSTNSAVGEVGEANNLSLLADSVTPSVI
eukprot:6189853-Pleurochrysis_carterae.AAC.1